YQQHFLREVEVFIGPTDAVLVTDAGCIKAYLDPLDATVDSLRSGLAALGAALSWLELGRMEMLLGVDGCVCAETTHLQTVVHVQGQPEVSLSNATVKLYPGGEERESLVGWHVCIAVDGIPDELAGARRCQTAIGTVLVLVCNDAAIFSA